MARTNAIPGCCAECGAYLEPGKGSLVFLPDADDVDDVDRIGTDRERAHWDLYCLDSGACAARVEAAKLEAIAIRKSKIAAEMDSKGRLSRRSAKAAWEIAISGLTLSYSARLGWTETEDEFDSGYQQSCKRMAGPAGETGWKITSQSGEVRYLFP